MGIASDEPTSFAETLVLTGTSLSYRFFSDIGSAHLCFRFEGFCQLKLRNIASRNTVVGEAGISITNIFFAGNGCVLALVYSFCGLHWLAENYQSKSVQSSECDISLLIELPR